MAMDTIQRKIWWDSGVCVCLCVGGGTDFLDVEKGNFMILLGLWDRKLSAFV
jgi:hypothetical protein